MARRNRAFRRFARGDREYVWCGLLTNANAIAANTAEEQLIITDGDWATATGRVEAVCERIRGSMSMVVTPNTETSLAVQLAIFKCSTNQTPYAIPWVVDQLVEEDVLLFKQWQVPRSATGIAQAPGVQWDIDVKAKRRVTNYEDIRILVACTGAATYQIATRALVRI